MKGQIITTEFMLVATILVVLLIASLSFWFIGSSRFQENVDRTEIQLTALDVSDQLVKSGGFPEDWNEHTSTTVSLGLVVYERDLDQSKVETFMNNLTYSEIKDYLAIENLEILVTIYSLDGQTLYQTGSYPDNPETVANVRRAAVLGTDIVHVDVMIWQ